MLVISSLHCQHDAWQFHHCTISMILAFSSLHYHIYWYKMCASPRVGDILHPLYGQRWTWRSKFKEKKKLHILLIRNALTNRTKCAYSAEPPLIMHKLTILFTQKSLHCPGSLASFNSFLLSNLSSPFFCWSFHHSLMSTMQVHIILCHRNVTIGRGKVPNRADHHSQIVHHLC